MIYIELFISFFKIGLFSFGGGYAMIPLISKEIESHGWLTPSEFVEIIGIAEMTPGPIAVNSATFVGAKAVGVLGSIVATLGVALPSLLIILLISGFFFRNSNSPLSKLIFYGVRPVIAGLIISASFFIAKTSFFEEGIISLSSINYIAIIISVFILILSLKSKIHPIVLIIMSGVLGFVFA
ncbi:chromate transporter [Maledivibacter halophilus]|uniref:Chromate transporter n=1 Tax=Maledivibacter halophilus TaxID=36842 RepID=A0A1T5M624_9FIRM|nr:chromate transporter [Maledivibacter halophilus]SKC83585.1 chromate transporter [Maledivibacter halophilus]